jgi:hypothetical protein
MGRWKTRATEADETRHEEARTHELPTMADWDAVMVTLPKHVVPGTLPANVVREGEVG